jgi:hypothetical protein
MSRGDLITGALYLDVQEGGPRLALRHLADLAASDSNANSLSHVYAHDVGRYAFRALGLSAYASCTPEFESGCYHGLIEAYVHRVQNLDEITRVCDRIAGSEPARRECAHGLGHGLWFRLPYREALTYCDGLDSIASDQCRDGVFMQRAGATHHAMHEAHDLHCDAEPALYRAACWHYQPRLMVPRGYPAAFAMCDRAGVYANDCYWGLGKWIAGTARSDAEIVARCREGLRMGTCMAGAATHLMNRDWTTAHAEHLCHAGAPAARAVCDSTVIERKALLHHG